jgi:hypothetical protein
MQSYNEAQKKVIRAILVGYSLNFHSTLVFTDLDTNEYVMCTMHPFWMEPVPKLREEGFLEYETTVAGETEYVYRHTCEKNIHKTSANIFKKFVPLCHQEAHNKLVPLK